MDLSREMYREHILELYKHPQNFGELKNATHKHRGYNPLCGDDFTMQIIIKDNKIQEIKFIGKGCAISTASASLLTEKIKGMTIEEVMKVSTKDALDLLEIPIGPVRLKCALLPLEAIHKAVK